VGSLLVRPDSNRQSASLFISAATNLIDMIGNGWRISSRPRGVVVAALLAPLLALGGCGATTTETGYEPHKLGMGDAQRRGLYAAKYSPEQAKAQAEADAEAKRRTPAPGAMGP
jgi:hypothetical protein